MLFLAVVLMHTMAQNCLIIVVGVVSQQTCRITVYSRPKLHEMRAIF